MREVGVGWFNSATPAALPPAFKFPCLGRLLLATALHKNDRCSRKLCISKTWTERFICRRKRKRTGKDEVNLSAAKMLLFGALAGAAAESILYPLEVLRRRCAPRSLPMACCYLSLGHCSCSEFHSVTQTSGTAGEANLPCLNVQVFHYGYVL